MEKHLNSKLSKLLSASSGREETMEKHLNSKLSELLSASSGKEETVDGSS